LTGETLRPVDQWRQLSKSADAAFLGLMDEYKITLQPAVTVAAAAEAAPAVKPASEAAAPAAKEPVSEPVSEPAVIQPETSKAQAPAETRTVSAIPNQLVLALAASLLVLLGAGLMIRRRAASQRSSQA
jgi:cell envelope opacity-associated protein A